MSARVNSRLVSNFIQLAMTFRKHVIFVESHACLLRPHFTDKLRKFTHPRGDTQGNASTRPHIFCSLASWYMEYQYDHWYDHWFMYDSKNKNILGLRR